MDPAFDLIRRAAERVMTEVARDMIRASVAEGSLVPACGHLEPRFDCVACEIAFAVEVKLGEAADDPETVARLIAEIDAAIEGSILAGRAVDGEGDGPEEGRGDEYRDGKDHET